MTLPFTVSCPLCSHINVHDYFTDNRREYLHCPECSLVFVPCRYHLNDADEKKIYDLHENDPLDQGYRQFLSRLADPLMVRLPEGAHGLDFGCGPGPALVRMLEEKGFKMSGYDKFYKNDSLVLNEKYDFICSTEVVEHLQDPAAEFRKLFSMLKTGGLLALMTKMVIDREAFSKWHYIQDLSHISFYSKETFAYLGRQYGCLPEFIDRDVIFFQK